MNQKTLRFALRHSQELVEKAQEIQQNTFASLSPDCGFYSPVGGGRKVCAHNGNYGSLCKVENCPHVNKD